MKNDLSKIPDHILRAAFNPRRFAEGGPTFGGNDEDDDLDSYFGDLGSISSTPTNDSGEGGGGRTSGPTETKTDTSTSSLGTKTTSAPDPKAVNASPVSTSSNVSFGKAMDDYRRIAGLGGETPESELNNTEQEYRAPTFGAASTTGVVKDIFNSQRPSFDSPSTMGTFGQAQNAVRIGIGETVDNVGIGDVINSMKNRDLINRDYGNMYSRGTNSGGEYESLAHGRYAAATPDSELYARGVNDIANALSNNEFGNPNATDFIATGIRNGPRYAKKSDEDLGPEIGGQYFGNHWNATQDMVMASREFGGLPTGDPVPSGPSEIPQPVSNPSAKEILQQLAAQNAPQGVNSLMTPPKPTPKPEQPTQLSGQLPDAPVTLAELMSQLDKLKSITARKGPAQEGFYAESNFTQPTYSRTNPNKIQDRIPAEEEEHILEIENVPVEQSADGTNFSPESTLRKAEYAARNPAEYGMPGIPGADLATLPGMVRGISELASEIPSFDVNQLKAPAKQKIGLDFARVFGKDDDLITKYGGQALTGTIKSGLDYLNGIKNDFAAKFGSQSPSQSEAKPSIPTDTPTQDEKSHLTKGADGEWSLDGDRVGFGVTRDMSPEDVVKTLEKEGYDPSQIDFGAPPTNQDAAPEAAPEEDVPNVPSYTDGIYGIMGQSELHPTEWQTVRYGWRDIPYPRNADGSYKTAADVSQDDMLSMKARRTDGVEAYTEPTPEEEEKRQNKYKAQKVGQKVLSTMTGGVAGRLPDVSRITREYDERPSWEQAYIKAQAQKQHPDFYNPDTRGTDSYIPDPDSPYFPIWLEEQQNAIWGRKWG